MKTLLLVSLLSSLTWSCDKGCEPHEGICACDQVPEQAPPVEPAHEKAPKTKVNPWEEPGIHADMPQNLISKDQADDEKAAEGKVPVR